MGYSIDFEKERLEALRAGRTALASLQEARRQLSKARGWGIYDTFFKGGFVSGLIKHSKMNNAQNCITRAGYDLQRFTDELHDLDLMGINLDTGDLLGFADLLFDGFIVDIFMQGRIRKARAQVDDAIYEVKTIIRTLEKL